MQLRARLVHAEAGRRVVQVTALEGERVLGSALGEAPDAEQAEDRALERLLARLGGEPAPAATAPGSPPPPRRTVVAPAPSRSPAAPCLPPLPLPPEPPTAAAPDSLPASPAGSPPEPPAPAPSPAAAAPAGADEPPPDPEDWSAELVRLDLELRRLGWGRDEESIYLQRAFSHPSRSRLTTWADLVAYLTALEGLEAGCDPAQAPIPLRRRDLLAQSDQLLARLGWQAGQGRAFLERHLGVASRQQLDDRQLLQFNMLLEGELITGGAAPEGEGAHARVGDSVRAEERPR